MREIQQRLLMYAYNPQTPEEAVKPYLERQPIIKVGEGDQVNTILGLPSLYAEVFADPPWNEFCQCSNCDKYYGRDFSPGGTSPCCSAQLNPAYPFEDTAKYIFDELSKPEAMIALLNLTNQLIGFAWGYKSNILEFIKNKYRIDVVRQNIKKILEELGLSEFFYFSECGIRNDFRGNGYANQLSEIMVSQAKTSGLPLLMRTNCLSPMVVVAGRFRMTQVLGPKVLVDRKNRRINLTGETINGIDEENNDRVLFVKFPE